MSAAARVPIFLNARAGTSTTEADALARQLGEARVEIIPVDAALLRERVAAAAAAGIPIIGVAGGDGSMRTAASALIDTGSALLTVPTGTLNHFARRCGIGSVDAAAAALREPVLRAQPACAAGGHIFLNTLTVGEYARTVRIRERWRPYIGKWPAALVGAVRTAWTRRNVELAIDAAGAVLVRRTPLLWIGIGWGSFPRVHEALDRRSSPDLEIVVLRPTSTPATIALMFRIGWRTVRGDQPVRDATLEVLHARSLTLAARRTVDATADGEVLRLEPPVRIVVRDDALRIVGGPDAR